MATCARANVQRATHAGTPLRSTQVGAPHQERAKLAFFFFPSSPLISAIAVLSSSPPSVSPLSTTVDAITVTFPHSSFHQPQHQSPSSSAAVAVLFSSHLLASVAILLVSSSSRHCSSRLLFLSTSDYYLDHRRHLPSLFLSLAPPSASQHHLPLLPLLRAHESSHRPLPPSPFPPPSTIELLSPFSLSVAVIPMPSPSSLASTDADLPLFSLSSLLHLVVGSLLLLPVTDPTSISPSAISLLPLRPPPLLAPPSPSPSSSISLSPPSPLLHVLSSLLLHRRTPPRATAASVAAVAICPCQRHGKSPFPPPFWFGWVKVGEEGDELCVGRSVGPGG